VRARLFSRTGEGFRCPRRLVFQNRAENILETQAKENAMNMTRQTLRNTLGTALVLILVVGATTSLAGRPGCGARQGGMGDGPGGPGCDGPGSRMEMMTRHLDLSEEQQTAIQEIRDANRQKVTDLRKDLMKLQNERRGEMLEDSPSEKTVVDLTDRIGNLKTEMQTLRVKCRLAVRKELTAEQRDRMLLMGKGHGARGCDGPQGKGRHGRGACDGACRQGQTPRSGR